MTVPVIRAKVIKIAPLNLERRRKVVVDAGSTPASSTRVALTPLETSRVVSRGGVSCRLPGMLVRGFGLVALDDTRKHEIPRPRVLL